MNQREEAINFLNRFFKEKPFYKLNQIDDVSKGMGSILRCLEQSEGKEIIAGDLAKELNCSTARIATLLNKLYKKNLIEKKNSKEDLRKTIVCLTDEGKKFISDKKEKVINTVIYLMDSVGIDTLNSFLDNVVQIKKALSER